LPKASGRARMAGAAFLLIISLLLLVRMLEQEG
jgi:hypothetical protein